MIEILAIIGGSLLLAALKSSGYQKAQPPVETFEQPPAAICAPDRQNCLTGTPARGEVGDVSKFYQTDGADSSGNPLFSFRPYGDAIPVPNWPTRESVKMTREEWQRLEEAEKLLRNLELDGKPGGEYDPQ